MGNIIPRRLKIRAALVYVGLPHLAGVDLKAFEAFWGPHNMSAADAGFVPLDLNSAEGGVWDYRSLISDVFDVDFSAGQRDIAEALMERQVDLQIIVPERGPNLVNAIA